MLGRVERALAVSATDKSVHPKVASRECSLEQVPLANSSSSRLSVKVSLLGTCGGCGGAGGLMRIFAPVAVAAKGGMAAPGVDRRVPRLHGVRLVPRCVRFASGPRAPFASSATEVLVRRR